MAYYILYKDGKGYKTTSDNYSRYAEAIGYKYLGGCFGRNVSCDMELLALTKEEKLKAKVSARLG